MPSFLVGFKCPAPPEGEQRLRWDILGDLACDILMGDSSPLFSRLYSQGLINGSFGSSFDLLPGAAYAYAGGDSNDPSAVMEAILGRRETDLANAPSVRTLGTVRIRTTGSG